MTPLQLLQDIFWSGIAALGFAVLFNTPPRLLLGCFLVGALGHPVRSIVVSLGGSLEFATLIGAVAVGLMSVYLSIRYHVPASSFAATGAIPLVPGVFAYRTIISLLDVTLTTSEQRVNFLTAAATNGVQTTLILGALAFGIAAPSVLFRRSNVILKEEWLGIVFRRDM